MLSKLFAKKSWPGQGAARFEMALFGVLAAVLWLNGCTMVGPDFVKPEAPIETEWLETRSPGIKTEV